MMRRRDFMLGVVATAATARADVFASYPISLDYDIKKRRVFRDPGDFESVAHRFDRPVFWVPGDEQRGGILTNRARDGSLVLPMLSDGAWDDYDAAAGYAHVKIDAAQSALPAIYEFDPPRNVFGNSSAPGDSVFSASLFRFVGPMLIANWEMGAFNSAFSWGKQGTVFNFATGDASVVNRPFTEDEHIWGVAMFTEASSPQRFARVMYSLLRFAPTGAVMEHYRGDVQMELLASPPYTQDGGVDMEGTIDVALAADDSFYLYSSFMAQMGFGNRPDFSGEVELEEQAEAVFVDWMFGRKDVPFEWYAGDV